MVVLVVVEEREGEEGGREREEENPLEAPFFVVDRRPQKNIIDSEGGGRQGRLSD